MGKNAIRLLKFAIKYRGWHEMGRDRRDIAAMNTLEAHGFIEVTRYPNPRLSRPQFRFIDAAAQAAEYNSQHSAFSA